MRETRSVSVATSPCATTTNAKPGAVDELPDGVVTVTGPVVAPAGTVG